MPKLNQIMNLIEFLNAYPTWVKLTVLFLLFSIITLLVIYSPRDEKAKETQKLFDIRPIQSSGENIFYREKKQTIGAFFVKVHFDFWTLHPIELININLSYSLPTAAASPGSQKIAIDSDSYEELDGSYRMKHRKKFESGIVTNIFVSRRFKCRWGDADYADYGKVTLNFEIASSAWDGIKNLQVVGKLEPGGKLEIEKRFLSVV